MIASKVLKRKEKIMITLTKINNKRKELKIKTKLLLSIIVFSSSQNRLNRAFLSFFLFSPDGRIDDNRMFQININKDNHLEK